MRYNTKLIGPFIFAAAFMLFTSASIPAADGPNASPEKEKELLGILRSGAPAERAMACKHLAIYGSSQAVADLAKLLSDEQLASWSRIALEAIPGPEADEALRKATESLTGKLLIGTINSIGVRRDAKSVATLVGRLKDTDEEVVAAAAVALGRIGNADATKALRGSLTGGSIKVRSAAAEGCVLCAERSLAEGRDAEAIEIYDEVRKAEVSKPRIIEATRGAILARKQGGIPLLVEQLKSADKGLFSVALSTARELPGKQVDEALATELAATTPDKAPLIIAAMADRKDTVVLAALVKAAQSGQKPVRISAIQALGRVGDISCLPTLLEIGAGTDADLTKAARSALSELPGENVDKEIVNRLGKAQGASYPLLIEIIGARRIDAGSALVKAVDHSDKSIRAAALKALGETISANNLPVLIAQAVTPKHQDDASVAQQALKAACVRMADREACAAELAKVLDRSPVATKVVLLDILAAVGGTKALNTLGAAAKSSDAQLQDTSTRLLGEWMTIDAAPVLLDLAKTAPGDKYQVRALRGYIRIARQFVIPEPERLAMCEKAYDAARHPAERKLVLEVLQRYPSMASLKMAVNSMKVPELKDDATQASLTIAQKLGAKGGDARQLQEILSNVGLERVKLEIVKAEYGSGSTQVDVTETLRKQVTDLPLIALPKSSYNASFGGDPAPGTVKVLKVKYRLNGKASDATFAENAVIIFPMPK